MKREPFDLKESLLLALIVGMGIPLVIWERVEHFYNDAKLQHTLRVYTLVLSSLILGNRLTQGQIDTLLKHTGYWFSEKRLSRILHHLHREGYVLRWASPNEEVRYELSPQGKTLLSHGV